MKLVMCSIRDVAANAFQRPYFVQTVLAGVRAFEDAVRHEDASNLMARHPEHFQLFHLGSFDEDSGIFETLTVPVLVSQASDFVARVNHEGVKS